MIPMLVRNVFILSFFLAFVCCYAKAAAIDHVEIGDMTIYPLVDVSGERDPSTILVGATPEQMAKYFPDGKAESTILAFLVKMPGKTILFDTGLGAANGGKASQALHDAGIAAEDIDTIVITHLHPDHFGGLAADGKPLFPNAKVYLGKQEKDWWLSDKRAGTPYASRGQVAGQALAAYPGKIEEFAFGQEIFPGVTAVDASGHTAGHTIFRVKSGSEEFMIVADIMHVAEIQFPLPDITVTYDTDQAMAAQARRRVLKTAAAENLPIAGMHLPLPGIWRVGADGDGYVRLPLAKGHF